MRNFTGGPGRIVPCHKLVGYGTALFVHDLVTAVASGVRNTTAISAAITPGTTVIFGVNLNHGAVSTLTDHSVVLGAGGAVFVAQCDGSGSDLTVAVLNQNANVAMTAGDAGTKRSKHQISETSIASTNTLDMRILKLWEAPDNLAAEYARVECRVNRDQSANQIISI
jgi:hypothetical protein